MSCVSENGSSPYLRLAYGAAATRRRTPPCTPSSGAKYGSPRNTWCADSTRNLACTHGQRHKTDGSTSRKRMVPEWNLKNQQESRWDLTWWQTWPRGLEPTWLRMPMAMTLPVASHKPSHKKQRNRRQRSTPKCYNAKRKCVNVKTGVSPRQRPT